MTRTITWYCRWNFWRDWKPGVLNGGGHAQTAKIPNSSFQSQQWHNSGPEANYTMLWFWWQKLQPAADCSHVTLPHEPALAKPTACEGCEQSRLATNWNVFQSISMSSPKTCVRSFQICNRASAGESIMLHCFHSFKTSFKTHVAKWAFPKIGCVQNMC